MSEWKQFIPDKERMIYDEAGLAYDHDLGENVALIVIDCTYSFIGSNSKQNQLESIKDYPAACGPVAWDTLPKIAELISECRIKGYPIIYTRNDLDAQLISGVGATKGSFRRAPLPKEKARKGNMIPDIIRPKKDEWILEKVRASAFHGTSLSSHLRMKKVDTLIICGATTSGCVRATVVDAFSDGFNVFVVDSCCFDRARTPHLANLWDMNAKYATVVSLSEIKQ